MLYSVASLNPFPAKEFRRTAAAMSFQEQSQIYSLNLPETLNLRTLLNKTMHKKSQISSIRRTMSYRQEGTALPRTSYDALGR